MKNQINKVESNDEIKSLNSLPSETSPNEISDIYYNILNEKKMLIKKMFIQRLTLSLKIIQMFVYQHKFFRIVECNKKFGY